MISAVDSPKVGAMIYDGSKMNQFRSMKGHMFIAAMVLIFSITNIESARIQSTFALLKSARRA